MHGNEPGIACLPSTAEVRVSPGDVHGAALLRGRPVPGIKDAVPGAGGGSSN
jgi:hypothetical protein